MIVALLIVIIGALLWPSETKLLIALPFIAAWWLITAPFRLVIWLLAAAWGLVKALTENILWEDNSPKGW